MGRPKGSKNKTNGQAANGIGHNGDSKLTDDERRALTLHHKRLYEAADALVEAAKNERTQVGELAKADLGKGALGEIKDMIAFGDEKKLKAEVERKLRLARWMGLPVGMSVDLFADRQPAEERWAAEGKTAGMAGQTCTPPVHLPPSGHQVWIGAWHEGQAILASAFGKRKADTPAATNPPPDATDAPFHAPSEA